VVAAIFSLNYNTYAKLVQFLLGCIRVGLHFFSKGPVGGAGGSGGGGGFLPIIIPNTIIYVSIWYKSKPVVHYYQMSSTIIGDVRL
jgi:hypothetical protein